MAQRRTTHRSSKGTKLYAVRKADGTFKDIQTYKRAHAADLRASSKDETSAKSRAAVAAKQAAAKTATKAAKTAQPATSTIAAVSSGLLARAKKAVGGVLKTVAPKKTPQKRVAKSTPRKATKKSAS